MAAQTQNDWQRRYRASVAESLAGPAISRSQLRVLLRVAAVYLIFWVCIGVWTLAAEWGRVYLPGVSSFGRLRNDLAPKALAAIVSVSLLVGIRMAWRWWRRRAFARRTP